MPSDHPRILTASIASSLYAWLAYAVCEQGFIGLLPLLRSETTVVSPHYWRLTALLALSYAGIGLVLGAVTGIIAERAGGRSTATDSDRWRLAGWPIVILLAANATNLLSTAVRPGTITLAAVLSVVLALLILLALRSPVPTAWRGVVLSPWLAGLVCAGTAVVHGFFLGEAPDYKAAVALGITAAAVCVVWAARRIRCSTGPSTARQAARRIALAAVILFAAIWWFGRPRLEVQARHAHSGRTGPHVFLIVLDTVRADHLSVLGYSRATTPHLERLAAESTVYRNAIASSDVTLSTHASMFTGLYARRHGAVLHRSGDHAPLRAGSRTMAARLRERGYFTAAAVANHGFVNITFGLLQGFETYIAAHPVMYYSHVNRYLLWAAIRSLASRFMDTGEFDVRHRRGGEITSDAIRLIGQRGPDPLFLFLNYMDAHHPYTPPRPYSKMFPGSLGFTPDTVTYRGYADWIEKISTEKERLPEREKAHFISQYDGGIRYMDAELGRLFERIKSLGMWDSSLVIVTSDHGEAFGERNLFFHSGVSAYQDLVHVPLLIKYPNQKAGRSATELVSQVDLLPTVAAVTGIAGDNVDGRALAPEGGSAPPSRTVFSEVYPNKIFVDLSPRFDRIERAAVTESLKLVTSTHGKNELYDLATDPDELRDLYQQDDPRVRQLQEQLQQHLKNAAPAAGAGGKRDKNTLERLRSLGYVQ